MEFLGKVEAALPLSCSWEPTSVFPGNQSQPLGRTNQGFVGLFWALNGGNFSGRRGWGRESQLQPRNGLHKEEMVI